MEKVVNQPSKMNEHKEGTRNTGIGIQGTQEYKETTISMRKHVIHTRVINIADRRRDDTTRSLSVCVNRRVVTADP